jgi:hypothetical protein
MPRAAKPRTMTGAPAQPIGAVAGQEYGMGVAQMDLQRQLPAPNVQASSSPAPPQAAAVPPQTAPGVPEQLALDPMAAAAAMQGGPGLFQMPRTSTRPLTEGLPSGPGAGPEIMGPSAASPLARTMQLLSERTGDSFFTDLARRNGMV